MNAPLRCPKCGTLMNRHAEKSFNDHALDKPLNIDPDFGGAISSVHYCPGCGNVEIVAESMNS